MFRRLNQAALAVFCMVAASIALANPLQISIEPGAQAGVVEVSLTNTGANAVSVLRWDTPFEDTLSHSVFSVEIPTKDYPYRESVAYTGRTVKRSSVSDESYILIDAGDTITANILLNEHYDIDQFGMYGIRFAGDVRYKEVSTLTGRSKEAITDVASLDQASMHSDSMTMVLAPSFTQRLRPIAYNSCSVEEQADILEAATIAETLTQTALTDLRGLGADERASSPRYSTWFGTYTESRFNRVVSNFEAIENAMANETLQFNCNCNEAGIYAFVYPAFPYSVTLCPEFRNASPNGENSRAGTIIHEVSHFTIVADTDDHAYSQSGSRALANSSPDLAIANADSHEYFAENAPALPIRRADDDPAATQYPSLLLGTEVQANVAANERNTYQVTNADQIELTSVAGDADLFVYSDSQFTDEICQSREGSDANDVCEIFVDGTVYVQIEGYTESSYTVLATGDAPIVNTDVIVLTLDTTINRSIAQREEIIYQVSGASVVDLESLSGDADLYIFNDVPFSNDTLVCSSANFSQENTLDRCNVPSTDATYYIAIYGYSEANFSLVARSAATTNVTRLTLGQTITKSIAEGEFNYYVVSGANEVVLTSTSGDADLLVSALRTLTRRRRRSKIKVAGSGRQC